MMVVVVMIHVSHRCVDVFSAVVQLADFFYTDAALLIFLTMTMTFSILTISWHIHVDYGVEDVDDTGKHFMPKIWYKVRTQDTAKSSPAYTFPQGFSVI